MAKYVFVTGGVVSGLGKGIVAASLGRLLKLRGYKVAAQKFDPYMNIDPGTMNPTQHGEVFVTHDGAETDLDLGHYERFIDENLTKFSNLTSGKVFWSVLNKERNGEYLGETVQIIPHVTNEIKHFIVKNAELTGADVVITEIGGTIGDIESQPFLEAIRQFASDVGRKNCLFIHVCLVPYISGSDEYKSKPAQHSTKELQAMGISPDIIITRSDDDCGDNIRKKIALFCSVKEDCVIANTTANCLYEVPLMLHKNGLDKVVCRELGLKNRCDLAPWREMVRDIHSRKGETKIAIVGKYVSLHDSYLSIVEALNHASYANHTNVKIEWVDSEEITRANVAQKLGGIDGILIPGGFGIRGTEGMINACRYAREKNIPYFGICLGMQIAVIEYARHVAGIKDATSGEFKKGGSHVIDLMPDQNGKILGGTMRLGAYPCAVKEHTQMFNAYGEPLIEERHRHRYEFNNDYRKQLIDAGLTISGTSPDDRIVETVEIAGNDFFIGVQFHPEFTSRPNKPNPLFREFVKAAVAKRR
ncbi:MAG: CTP synthase [Bacteroides sp.]|nr:CTP synthase [Bacillota bacterium]MCM1394045.1 CTP synthase [[Eubacterium] siraeum]MCM1455497.1 CTP synthase [Bacteroides sp.]